VAEGKQTDNVGQQLSLSARPKTLDGLLGQDKLIAAIRGHFKSGRYPKAWLFAGTKGTGKTTTARILALSYQCTHQKTFGRPCLECRRNKTNFQITEISAAVLSKKEDMAGALAGAHSGVMGDGAYRVYIINEIQRAGPGCLSQFLDMLEDTPPSTVFIFTTTEPGRLSDAFRSRCISYEFRDLEMSDVEKLVERLLTKIGSDLPADRLSNALADNMVRSPRLIAQAVEKYCAGCDPADAAMVSGAATIDILGLSRAITRGHWDEAARYLQNVDGGDARALRVLLLSYLKTQLLETPDMGPRGDAVAKAILLMSSVANAEDAVVFAAICSSCYTLCILFSKYSF
jgi:DNA polymerase III gamma/tau subunit